MNIRELIDRLTAAVQSGDLDPQAVVVRPLCMCDQDTGWIEVMHIDQVHRTWREADCPGGKIFDFGSGDTTEGRIRTVKLG